jgi:hypothetical protein
LDTSLDDALTQILRRMHFETNSILRKLETKFKQQFPILVRPIKKEYSENDWYIKGIDMRNINSWYINEICSDGG